MRIETETLLALDLPLLKNNPHTGNIELLAGNLKQRFGREISSYLQNVQETLADRPLLNIERVDCDSIRQMIEPVTTTIDKLISYEPVKKTDLNYLVQYLSWSFFQSAERGIEDPNYQPTTQSQKDLKSLFNTLRTMPITS
ncbi:hypothetical protein KKG65_03280 [Patescibacteria group bacterium]|nr:hypothetical protein [Patescibacteria group bacterium]